MFNQILLSPQVERGAVISNKHGIYELSHELPNDLRLKICWNYKLVPILPPKLKTLSITAKSSEKQKLNLSRRALFLMKTRVCLMYFVNYCSLLLLA